MNKGINPTAAGISMVEITSANRKSLPLNWSLQNANAANDSKKMDARGVNNARMALFDIFCQMVGI
jgi:hypothetical protein